MEVLRTRATGVASASTARAALATVVVLAALVLATATLAATAAPASAAGTRTGSTTAPLRTLSDAQLADRAAAFDAEATRIGESLLEADARRDSILLERDAARGLLAEFLADSYKQGVTSGGSLTQVLTATSLSEVVDRARVAQVVSDHHHNLIHSLDDAEARLDVDAVRRAQLITRLTSLQSQLVDINTEQGRRLTLRAEQAQARKDEADAKARKAAADAASIAATSAPGTLVGNGGGATPLMPAVGPGTQPSAALIDAYLASKGSVMAGQGAAFMASGQRYQVDPRLLVAIAGAESNFGDVTCGPNNAWGWACPNDPADFGTWADGIDTVTRGLRTYYLDEGRTSVSLIQQKYCPVGAANDPTGLNNHWRDNVTRFLLELGGNPSMVGPGPTGGLKLPDLGGLGIIGTGD